MKINLTLKDGTRFAVNLSLDLKAYCEAYAELRRCKTHFTQLNDTYKVDKSLISDGDFNVAKGQLEVAATAFATLRSDYAKQLISFSGEIMWRDIKGLLKTQCNLDEPWEHELHAALSATAADSPIPLVIECLNMSFTELWKNSIDGILINYTKDASTTTTLRMEISLSVIDSVITVHMKDNAGGFSAEYLAYFASITSLDEEHKIKSMGTGSKRAYKGYCFGGNGIGHAALASFILRGELLMGNGGYTTVYAIEKGATAFRIGNNEETHGAEIMLRTPMAPFPAVLNIGREPTPVILELPAARGVALGFFAAPEPAVGKSSSGGEDLAASSVVPLLSNLRI